MTDVGEDCTSTGVRVAMSAIGETCPSERLATRIRASLVHYIVDSCREGGRHVLDLAYGRFDCRKCQRPLTIDGDERIVVFA